MLERTGPGSSWQVVQILDGAIVGIGEFFGSSLAAQGNTLAVGATRAGLDLRGQAVLFERVGGVWVEDVRLAPGSGQDYASGSRIALSGNTLAVAATGANAPRSAVYVFDRDPGGWSLNRKFNGTHESVDPFNYWGTALALEGDTLLVGEYGADHANPASQSCSSGAVHVYRRTGSDFVDWQLDTITLDAPVCGDYLGYGVAIDGDRFVAGAPVSTGGGAAVVFERASLGSTLCMGFGCPCGNDDSLGGCASSTGRGATLAATGSASVSADDLRLRASGLSPGRLALFVVSTQPTFAVFGDGLLCAASPWTRYASQLANALDGGTIVLDDAVVASGGVLGAGSTAIFQCLYRDGLGSPCGTGMNATHALEIVLAP